MRKLPGYAVLITVFLLLACCNGNKSQDAVKELVATDKAFSQMCLEKGLAESFIFFADDSVIKLNDNAYPVIGKKNLEIALRKSKTKLLLQWEPLKAVASMGGDLGFTFGNWKLALSDTVLYGNYVSIWKRQKDGSWRYILDGGNSTPKPENK